MAPRTALNTRCFYTSQELLDIRGTTPEDLFPTFLLPYIGILDILVHAVKRRRRGKRAGALVRLRQHGHRTPLPGLFLSNVRSLCNKMDELQLLMGKNRLFFIFCFVFHGDVAVWIDTRLCAAAGRLPSAESGPRRTTFRQIKGWRYLFLH